MRPHLLFPPWLAAAWTPQNDSLRGGSSTSSLTVSPTGTAIFAGTLDSKTLGGAGFASVRTVGEQNWDWRGYEGLAVKIGATKEEKTYTLVLKNVLPPVDPAPRGPNGRRPEGMETSTVSFEYNFTPAPSSTVAANFAEFKPFYRGREMEGPDAPRLDLGKVERLSFMVRSFFGDEKQEGGYRLEIVEVGLVKPGEWKGEGGGEGAGWCSVM